MIAPTLVEELEALLDLRLDTGSARPVSGGCIHDSVLVETADGESLFLKQNSADALALFEAERASLELLHAAGEIRVPQPFVTGTVEGTAFFAMEGLTLSSQASPTAQALLGQKLAALHTVISPTGQFGADFDNFIGATPQSNRLTQNWPDFFVNERLAPQFRLAGKRGKTFAREAELCSAVHTHLSSLKITPVLLHGDLWGGNVGFLPDGEPVVFDPACYFGDRETDLAFTKMFGGFSPAFHAAYREIHPAPEPIYEVIYNLYHLLNHFNLFGGSYASGAEASIDRILKAM